MIRTALTTAVILGFATSALAQPNADVRLVTSWYERYLGREPDMIGLQDHVRALRRGTAPRVVESAILGSQEYWQRHGSTPEGFVTGLFYDVLNRPPSRPELTAWLQMMSQGGRNATALAFLQGQQTATLPALPPAATGYALPASIPPRP